MAIIEKTRNNKCRGGCREKGTLLHCWWECKLVQPLWKTVCRFLRKVKIELPYDPAIPLLGIYPKKMKTLAWKDICTFIFIAALFTIAKIQKQFKRPLVDEWIKKLCVCMCVCIHIYIHTHDRILFSHKKKWNLAICNNMDGSQRYYAKWNKSDRERQISYGLCYMWNLIYIIYIYYSL